MHPTLLHLPGLVLPTYGVAMALGYLVAVLLGARAARRQGIGFNRALDLSFWVLAAGVLGARLLYVATNAGQFYDRCVAGGGGPRGPARLALDCGRVLFFWEGGWTWYGGLLGAAAAAVWYLRRHRLGLLKTFDLALPGVALGHFFGRLGCWAAGCCYGKPGGGSLGLRFGPPSLALQEMLERGALPAGARLTPPLYPTQLLEAGAELLIFFVLLWVGHRKRRHGEVLLAYAALYALARGLIEVLRGDPSRRYLLRLVTPGLASALGLPPAEPLLLSTSQGISLLLLLAAAALWSWLRRAPAGSG